MIYDLAVGDVVHIGEAITLTVLAVEGDLIRFKMEPMLGECLGDSTDCEEADDERETREWELN